MADNKQNSSPLFYIRHENCAKCTVPVCAKVCPVSAVKRDNNKYVIDNERCIGCGDCLVYCPDGAVSFRNSIDEVRKLISEHKTVALLDPAIAGEFEDITDYRKFVDMIKYLGFDHVHEVSFGVDIVANKYNHLINNYSGKYYIFSTCPVIVNYVRKYHPELIDNLAPFMSPSIALAKYLRKFYDETVKFIYIGPCIASKDEEQDSETRYIDANITFRELRQMFKDSDIHELKAKFDDFDKPHGNKGAMYPLIDGLLYAAECERSPVFSMAGRRKSLDAVKTFASDIIKLQEHFNLFYCSCCSLGPGTKGGNFILSDRAVKNYAKKRAELLNHDEWRHYLDDAVQTDITTSFHVDDKRSPIPSKEDVEKILETIGRDTTSCQLCGFNSCRDFATNVAQGHVELKNCSFHNIKLRQDELDKAERERDNLSKNINDLSHNVNALEKQKKQLTLENNEMKVIMNNLNTAVVIVDADLNIIKANKIFINNLDDDMADIAEIIPELIGADFRSLVPMEIAELFKNVLASNENIENKDVLVNDKLYNVSVFPIENGAIAGGIIRDMHTAVIKKEQIINKIHEVINENLTMVQKIGFLLGEGASQTEKKLNSIIKTYQITDKQ